MFSQQNGYGFIMDCSSVTFLCLIEDLAFHIELNIILSFLF